MEVETDVKAGASTPSENTTPSVATGEDMVLSTNGLHGKNSSQTGVIPE